MSNVIDTNVVELKFDNKQFEEGCKESMNTLAKLKMQINSSTSGNALDGLNQSANKLDLSNIVKAIDKVNSHFSILGIAAMRVKNAIITEFKNLATAVPNIIKQGGWDRAMNIERAKFQLEGLHVAWQDIKGDIEYAVDGTAYGLDAAAKAASQLVASNVKVGDSMKAALRGISGVAAMTNAAYEDIAPIFTTVAGQGKLMTMQLRQLENRGLNAAAVLGEVLHKSEAEIRDMVTKGQIDFDTFSKAMNEAFGEHAKDANRTFEGVTANIKAALKKIGADFATPILEQDGPVILALQQLRLRINDVRASLGPLTEAWRNFVTNYGNYATRILKNLDMGFVKNLVNALLNSFNALLSVIRPIGYAFRDIFSSTIGGNIKTIAEAIENFTKKLVLSKSEMEDLRATVRGVLSIGDLLLTLIKQILGSILKVKPETINIRAILLKFTGTLGNIITYITYLVKQVNIIEPVITTIGTALKIAFGILGLGISKIIEFASYVRNLKATSTILNTLQTVVYALGGGVVYLASVVKNFVVNNASKVPGILSSIRTELSAVIDMLKSITVVKSAIDGINKLADSFKSLLKPQTSANTKELENTITIVDEAVALAGPQKVSMLDQMISVIKRLKDIVVDVGGKVVTFAKNLDYGSIAAVAFTLAIAGIGYKLSQTFQSISNTFDATATAIKQVGGLIGSFKDKSLMDLIFGKKEPPPQHKLLELAAAIISVALSFKLMSTIDVNKLKQVGIVFAGIGVGIITIIGALTAAQKFLGKGEAIVLSSTLFAITGSIALLTAALAAATKLDFTNIQKAGAAIAQLSVVLGGFTVALAILAPRLSKGALTLIAMSVSIRILIGALEKIQNVSIQLSKKAKDYQGFWGKAGALAVMATGLVFISGLSAKIGTSSLLGIVAALLSLKMIIPLATSVGNALKKSIFAELWYKIVDFFKGAPETVKKLGPYIAAAVAIGVTLGLAIKAFKTIKKALTDISSIGRSMGKEVGKTEYLQKALARLSLVPVIMALTGMFVAIGILAVVIGKIKLDYLDQAIKVMATMGGIMLALAVVIRSTKDSKPGAVIAVMVGLTMMFSELIVLSVLMNKHAKQVQQACAVMSAVMLSLAAVLYSVSKISKDNTKGLIAIGLIAVVVAELGGLLYILSQRPWDQMAASGAAMTACMLAFAKMITLIGETGQSFTKNKFLAIAECAAVLPVIAASLLIATLNHDWKAMLAAGASMSLVMLAFGGMMQIVGKTRWNAGAWAAIAGIAISAIAIGAALSIATLNYDWKAILAAGGAMSLVMAVFGGMAYLLGKMDPAQLLSAFVSMAAISVTAVAIGASLAMLCQYPWQDILAAAGIMAGLVLVLGLFTAALGALGEAGIGIIGAALLAVIAASMLALSAATTMLLGALTAFLPVADAFIAGVLGTLVSYAEQLPITALGLLELAGGLSAIGAAGLILTTGAIGLVAAAVALPALVSGVEKLAKIDFNTLASGMQAFIVPALEFSAVAVAIGALSPVLLAASVAIIAFSAAIATLSVVLNPALNTSLKAFTDKAEEAKKWGSHLIENFIAGIKSKIQNLKNAVVGVAQTIRDYLHFTKPDKGPLSDADKYGGDFIKLLCDGMSGAVPELEGTVSDIAGGVKDGMSGIDLYSIGNSLGMDFGQGGIDGLLNKLPGFKTAMSMYGSMADNPLNNKKTNSATSANDAKQEQLAMRKNAKAATEAAEANEDYSKAAGGSGKASKEASKDVDKLTDAFKKVERGARVSLDTMINNMADNYRETVLWAKDMKELMRKGFDKSITDYIQKMGVGGRETVKAFLRASEEQIPAINALSKRMLTLDDDAKKYIEGDYEKFAEDIGNVLSEGITSWNSQLEETVQGALDPFGEFDAKTDMTATKLLGNMNSQLKGIRTWGDNMAKLMDKNVNENILAYLAELGPKSYEYVNAMVNMTDEQLQQMSDIWEQQEHIGQEIALKLGEKAKEIGSNVGQGVVDGLSEMSGEVKSQTDKTFDEGMMKHLEKDIAETASPSKRTNRLGKNLILGLVGGLRKNYDALLAEINRIGNGSMRTLELLLSASKGSNIGYNLIVGISNGITKAKDVALEAIKSVCQSIIDKAKKMFDESSPSKVFREIGEYLDEGLAIGIEDKTNSVINATANVAESTIQMMNDIIKNIADDVNDSPELQPVIRPELDLTRLQNGKSRIAGMLGNTTYAMAASVNATQQSTAVNTSDAIIQVPSNNQTIIFNQTNNSPKALDRYEIYRQTRNTLEMMKGATT